MSLTQPPHGVEWPIEGFIHFFEQMPTWQRLVWVAVCLTAGWIAENGRPLFRFDYRKWSHARVNLVFFVMLAVVGAAFAAGMVGLFKWIERREIGLLHRVDWPLWVELLVAVIALDLIAQYLAHFLLHKLGWMWKFHMVHHSDLKVDATTGTRLHPGDYVFRELFAVATIVVVGIPIAAYFFYRFLTIFFAYATHANIDMPRWLDRTLALVFVTPNMHKFHHHFELPWTDTNFGNIFSIWDRIFGTFVYDDLKRIRYGLNALDGRLDENLLYQLKLPFDRRIGPGK